MSGLALIEVARKLAPDMPVLVLTAYPMAETAKRCRELGTMGYLRKPIDPLVLMAEVQLVLDLGREEPSDP
jgi:CheY-like chemotaxis protein